MNQAIYSLEVDCCGEGWIPAPAVFPSRARNDSYYFLHLLTILAIPRERLFPELVFWPDLLLPATRPSWSSSSRNPSFYSLPLLAQAAETESST